MPGLNKNKRQGIDNINEMMELRNNDEPRNTTHQEGDIHTTEKVNANNTNNVDKRSSLYEKQRSSNGKNLRQRYNSGKLPRAHLELYQEIVAALGDKKRDIVLLKPILEKLDMNYMTSAKVFSLLEEYGYLYFERAQNAQGRLLIIENLHKI